MSRRSSPYPLGVLARTARTRGFGEHAVGMNQRPRYAVICSPAVGLARRLREGASGTAVRPGSVWLLGGHRNTFERGHQGVPCQWSWTCTRALTCADQIRWQWRVAPACRSKRSRDAVGGSVATQSESMTRATRPFAPGRSGRSQGHRPAEIVRPTGARSFRDHQQGQPWWQDSPIGINFSGNTSSQMARDTRSAHDALGHWSTLLVAGTGGVFV